MSYRDCDTYIVDGYNIMPELLSEEEIGAGLETARRLLESRLRAFRASLGQRVEVILVYDGAKGAIGSGAREPGFEVLFARPPLKADDAILQVSRELEGTRRVCVVTSDFADIGWRLRGLRVSHADSREFARMVSAALGSSQGPSEKPCSVSRSEAEAWLEDFGLGRFPEARATAAPKTPIPPKKNGLSPLEEGGARPRAERERELKFSIGSREDFLRLRDSPEWGARAEPVRQVNYYFDTDDFLLLRSGILLRIREEKSRGAPERLVLTLKCGGQVAPGCFESTEVEVAAQRAWLEAARRDPWALWHLPSRVSAELSQRIERRPLRLVGSLENERVRREVGGWMLEVDRIRFPDGTEAYELEIETERPLDAKTWVERELSGRGIRLEPEGRTKYERLVAAFGDLRSNQGPGD